MTDGTTTDRTAISHVPTLLREAWRLAKPYFASSEERWSARLLLLAILSLSLASVGIAVLMNFWRLAFYDAVQAYDQQAFVDLLLFYGSRGGRLIPGYAALALLTVASATTQTYLSKWLVIRWRRWLTARVLDRWLAGKAYYRLGLGDEGAVDNPDQRIAEDIALLCNSTLGLLLDLVSRTTTFVSFVSILWGMSATLALFGVIVPGWLFWAALIYAIVSTAITHGVGHPLARLNLSQQRREADFRSSLMRVRENAEAVALYDGEGFERRTLDGEFGGIVRNWRAIMTRSTMLGLVGGLYGQGGTILPIALLAPNYFAGAATLGLIMQANEAFGRVQNSLAWIIDAYAELARLRSVVHRLHRLDAAIEQVRRPDEGLLHIRSPDGTLRLAGLTLRLPDGKTLFRDHHLTLSPGRSVLISGEPGAGKSTLFRVLSGLWPYAAGRVEAPTCMFFLPQHPYIPPGPLRQAVCYPNDPDGISDNAIRQALADVDLGHLRGALDRDGHWGRALSGGEQQRLAVARAILARPRWLFLDEATANLDARSEQALYRTLSARLPDTTLVSISHRVKALRPLHDLHLVLADGTTAP